jgi:hypothetical protein
MCYRRVRPAIGFSKAWHCDATTAMLTDAAPDK